MLFPGTWPIYRRNYGGVSKTDRDCMLGRPAIRLYKLLFCCCVSDPAFYAGLTSSLKKLLWLKSEPRIDFSHLEEVHSASKVISSSKLRILWWLEVSHKNRKTFLLSLWRMLGSHICLTVSALCNMHRVHFPVGCFFHRWRFLFSGSWSNLTLVMNTCSLRVSA